MRRILAHLGEDANLRPAGGAASFTLRGIHLEPYQEMLAGGGLGVAGSKPEFHAMKDDAASVARGDILDRDGDLYRIAKVSPSATPGLVVLTLEK